MSRGVFPAVDELDRLLVGPDSVIWSRASDLRLYVGMVYPLLLQVAHPTVSAGVLDYSDFERRPWGRLMGTLDYASLLVYGGRDAVAVGRRLRSMHGRFKGVCVRDRDPPRRWDEFQALFDRTVAEELTRTEAVDRVLATIRRTPAPAPIPPPLWRLLRIPPRTGLWLGSIGLLPDVLRRRLGLRWTVADQASFRALGILSRGLTPVLPGALQVIGPRQLALRRGAIAHGPLGPLGPLHVESRSDGDPPRRSVG